MNVIKKTINNFKKYREYIDYMTKCELKLQLSSKYLGTLWWILDPIFYMAAYLLIVVVIFKKGGPHYPVYIFSALISWKWTSTSINGSVGCIKKQASVLNQVYIPKFIFPYSKVSSGIVDYLFSIIILFVLMLIDNVPFTLHILEVIPIIAINYIMILGICLFIAHFGVYFQDLSNILTFGLRMWFYVSPGLYSLNDIPEKYHWLWYLNPMTTLYNGYRNVFLYGKSPDYFALLVLLIASLIIVLLGLKTMYKYDKNYTKVI